MFILCPGLFAITFPFNGVNHNYLSINFERVATSKPMNEVFRSGVRVHSEVAFFRFYFSRIPFSDFEIMSQYNVTHLSYRAFRSTLWRLKGYVIVFYVFQLC